MISDISAAILAGGGGKRLGGVIKTGLMIGGIPIIARMLSVIREIFTETILVTNSGEEAFRDYGLIIVPDLITGRGPLGGIHSALKKASGKAVFVFAGDMPFPDRSLICREVDHYNRNEPEILVPRKGDMIEPLHSIYSKKVFASLDEYLRNSEKYAVRDFLIKSNTEYFEVTGDESTKRAFMNINSLRDIVLAEEIIRNDNT